MKKLEVPEMVYVGDLPKNQGQLELPLKPAPKE